MMLISLRAPEVPPLDINPKPRNARRRTWSPKGARAGLGGLGGGSGAPGESGSGYPSPPKSARVAGSVAYTSPRLRHAHTSHGRNLSPISRRSNAELEPSDKVFAGVYLTEPI